MKKKNQKKEDPRDLYDIFLDLKSNIDVNSELFEKDSKVNIDKIVTEFETANLYWRNFYKGIAVLVLFLVALVIFAFIYIWIQENDINNIKDDNKIKTTIIDNLKINDSTFVNSYNDSLFVRKYSDSTTYTTVKSRKTISYSEIYDLSDSIRKSYNEIKNQNSNLKIMLSLAKRNYNIKFRETPKTIFIDAPELDSAIMLLPFYRDRITHNKDKDTWTISH